MIVREAHRTRHLVIRLDRGDELPGALVRALDESEARSGFVTGAGTLEAAVLRNSDKTTYRLDAPSDVVSFSGTIAVQAGATSLQLAAVLSRATEVGLSTFGGTLTWGRVRSIELHAVIFDDVALARVDDPETGLAVLDLRASSASVVVRPAAPAPAPVPVVIEHARPAHDGGSAVRPAVAPPRPSPPPPAPAPVRAPAPAVEPPRAPPPPAPMHTPSTTPPNEAVALPQKPQKPKEDFDSYPEIGDSVMHFHFGECTVIGSDGDRIRLRQDRDGRVREVALTMLRIELSASEEGGGPDAPRHFKLHRKN
jgi:predicted DNA-binding protein with PD1-like motif